MIVTVFRSRLRPGAREEYIALVDRMVELAADKGLVLACGHGRTGEDNARLHFS